jgi:hypothetical protein
LVSSDTALSEQWTLALKGALRDLEIWCSHGSKAAIRNFNDVGIRYSWQPPAFVV